MGYNDTFVYRRMRLRITSSPRRIHTLKTVVKVLVVLVAFCLVTGSMSEDFGSQLVGTPRYGLCLMTFCSVAFLHLLVWQIVVGNSAILGRDPKSFLAFGRSKSFYSGVTTFGYVIIALHCLRIADFASHLKPNVLGYGDFFYGLTFGLTLIGIGLAARLRSLFQNLQTISG